MTKSALCLIVVCLSLILSLDTVSFAQENQGCDLQQLKSKYADRINAAETWGDLQRVFTELQSAVAVCNNGYQWSGYGNGSLGPVDLASGTYIFEIESSIDKGEENNYLNVHLEGITDDTESQNYIARLDAPGDASQAGTIIQSRDSAVLRLAGGKYLFKIDLLNFGGWTAKLYQAD